MDPIESHYASPDLVQKIWAGLEQSGKSFGAITPRDLAAVDQLHTGGAAVTISLVKEWIARSSLPATPKVLDAGCGTGGSSRLLAAQFDCRVSGMDLSQDFIDTAKTLTRWCGLEEKATFRHGSILDLPFGDASFDAVLCQHILMNIKDKPGALAEFFRVIRPGGSLILHEITRGEGPDPVMPVPWAHDPSTSFLVTWDALEDLLTSAGFAPVHVSDETSSSADWWHGINTRKKPVSPPALHPGLVFGTHAKKFGPNMEKNFSTRAVCCTQAILTRP